MNSQQILDQVSARRQEKSQFIRWWRKENDFVDYELLERFVARLPSQIELGGFELLSTEQMWSTMQRLVGNRVRREQRTAGEFLVVLSGRKETVVAEECRFTPENMMLIFDRETRGDTIQ